MDDELNILPTSTHVREIREVEMGLDGQPLLPTTSVAAAGELRELKETLADSEVPPHRSAQRFSSKGAGCMFIVAM